MKNAATFASRVPRPRRTLVDEATGKMMTPDGVVTRIDSITRQLKARSLWRRTLMGTGLREERRRLLDYLKRTDEDQFKSVVAKLGLYR